VTLPEATTSLPGLQSAADKTKLDGIAAGAQVNVPTNLSYTASTRLLESSTGNDVTLPEATATLSGLMSGADKTKLDSVEAGAQVNVATDLSYTASTRLLSSSTGADVSLPEATTTLAGLQSAADKIRIDQLGEEGSPFFTGLTVTGTANLEHIHGNLAGEVYQHVRADGVSLAALVPYHVTGSQGDTDRVLVIAARGDTVAAMPASGILPAALSSNQDGHGVVAGVITGVNTAGLTSGDPVYVGLTGGLTATRPTTGLVQVVAVIGRVHASTGSLAVAAGPALPPLAYTAAYGDLSGVPGLATTSTAGLMASADKAKLDGIEAGAQANVGTDLTYDAASREVRSSTGTDATLPLVSTSSAGLQPATGFGTITYAATVNLDLAALDGQVNTITLTGPLELTTSNLANGRSTGLRLIPGASSRTLIFPVDWVFVSAKPASLPANKVARLSIECHGTTNAAVVAAIAIQP
jgi:hypothetical protein